MKKLSDIFNTKHIKLLESFGITTPESICIFVSLTQYHESENEVKTTKQDIVKLCEKFQSLSLIELSDKLEFVLVCRRLEVFDIEKAKQIFLKTRNLFNV